jgi:hypothetical protein
VSAEQAANEISHQRAGRASSTMPLIFAEIDS